MQTTKHRQSHKVETFPPEPRRVEVEFVLECNGAEQVYICGDFNLWRPTSLRMIGNPDAGLWEKRLVLPPGRYEYKFVVDGNWTHDPDARENVSNLYGSLNSVVEVRP
jgi:1,4-alpha-glucan branching enzyme